MKTSLRKITATILILLIVSMLLACGDQEKDTNDEDNFDEDTIKNGEGIVEIFGYWVLDDQSDVEGKIIITTKQVDFHAKYMGFLAHALSCEIVGINNETFNGGEAGEKNHGHLLLKVKDGMYLMKDGNAKNKFMVLRWEDLNESGVKLSFSSVSGEEKFRYKATPDEAKSSLTKSNGCFDRHLVANKVSKKE